MNTIHMKIPGIFGSPQPSQVRAGSISQPVRSRLSGDEVASRHVKITPAFAYDPYAGKTRAQRTTSRAKARRLESVERAEYALKRIRNRPATYSGGNLS